MPKHTPPLLLETIKCEEGVVYNLPYHQARCNQSRKALFDDSSELDLSSLVHPSKQGLYRCRVLYSDTLHSIEYIPYTQKEIHSLKIITADIDYSHKYADRGDLNTLLLANQDTDELLIEKNGYLSDTTIANVAFYDGKQWVTPETPLLYGTTRARLIDEGFLQTKKIAKENLVNYSQVALMNAMLGFCILNHVKLFDEKGHTYVHSSF